MLKAMSLMQGAPAGLTNAIKPLSPPIIQQNQSLTKHF